MDASAPEKAQEKLGEKFPVKLEENLQEEIKAQIEYYFSDINLQKDHYIRFHSKNGWFPIDKLMSFNKLKELTTDYSLVLESIKSLALLEVDQEGGKIRRKESIPELTDAEKKEFYKRTLHLAGFPKESTFNEIKQFCDQLGKVAFVQMRRYPKNKKFKGCIMVSFANLEIADKILNGPVLQFQGTELLRESKEKYLERKAAWLADLKKKIKEKRDLSMIEVKGAILKISGLYEKTHYKEIKRELSRKYQAAYVTRVNSNSECMVRFHEEDGAKIAIKTWKEESEDWRMEFTEDDNKLIFMFLGQVVEFTIATEEEEKEFWREFQAKKTEPSYKQHKPTSLQFLKRS